VEFLAHGRVDRIDYHEQQHTLRILDYKSSDARKTPEQTHRETTDESKVWCDLQVPLYRKLAPACATLADVKYRGARIEVGYFCLPPQLDKCGVEMAQCCDDDYAAADASAQRVIEKVHRQIFWPPAEVPRFDDGLGALCFDGLRERATLIQRNDGDDFVWPLLFKSTLPPERAL
jgi:hypothetical protein